VVLGAARVIRGSGPPPIGVLAVGAILLAAPLAWSGYEFLRDDEQLAPYRGSSLVIRTLLCGAGYALLWGVFAYVYWRIFGDDPAEIWSIALLAPGFLFVGAGIAFCCYDLELLNGFFHYAWYLLVTILLRLMMGLPAVGPAETASDATRRTATAVASAIGIG